MSEDCQTCGTAMYELDEDRNCPGCSHSDVYYNWEEQEWSENKCFYENDLEHLLELPQKEKHPAWDKCSKGAKALHARNTFQILGPNLDSPSSFLICWAKVDKHGNISGGTATAWNLAKAHGVPCFNLYNEDDKQRLIKFVEGE